MLQILNEIAQHKIKIYEFPEEESDPTSIKMKQRVPFAVVGSNTTVEVDGKKLRGRRYPWGVVEGNGCFLFVSYRVKEQMFIISWIIVFNKVRIYLRNSCYFCSRILAFQIM